MNTANTKTFFIALAAGVFLLFLLGGCFGKQDPAPVRNYGAHGGANSAGAHTVASGDTLWSLSQRYDLSMQDIIYVNNLRPPYALTIGQRLTLPPPTTYEVRPGDTLYGISRTFGVSMTELARLNNMQAPYTIQRGEKIRLPAVKRTYKPKARKAPTRLSSRAPNKRVPKRTSSRFSWPVRGEIISTFGPKKNGLHNDGINIRARRGQTVKAAENGIVAYAGSELKGFGNLVLIRHDDGWMTAYAHLDRMSVDRGQEVRRGKKIGAAGSTGSVDRPQLHFEIRRGTNAIDPERHLAR